MNKWLSNENIMYINTVTWERKEWFAWYTTKLDTCNTPKGTASFTSFYTGKKISPKRAIILIKGKKMRCSWKDRFNLRKGEFCSWDYKAQKYTRFMDHPKIFTKFYATERNKENKEIDTHWGRSERCEIHKYNSEKSSNELSCIWTKTESYPITFSLNWDVMDILVDSTKTQINYLRKGKDNV
jgi:hypothetical protein